MYPRDTNRQVGINPQPHTQYNNISDVTEAGYVWHMEGS